MSYTPHPENMRVPQHLSETELHQALDELDAKIKTLRNRAHATTVNSENTYHEHIAALEVKRAKLADLVGPAGRTAERPASTWDEIRRGIDTLREDLRNII
ncbi:sll1863 family stress response protein [Hymenobacter chitinivorans]|uniref:Uncharacterized protein n=1 Tax=Hymenobacter chitinivorans DSM 11115 TaxID=1121954 RepID=A0A2M9BN94_9BACT|nr:hypothetical protein [Hymenobacter chitinivorans]PJJ59380.1 hypothetical protein CLV45_0797 [Hymenobacter chitinivorans DSM 11115]